MSETNEQRQIIPLQLRQQMGIIPQNYTELIQLGRILAASGYFADAKSEAQAVAKIIAGAEAGFGPMASLTGIHIVQGKPTFGANLMAAAVKGSGRYSYKIKKLDDAECVLEFYERGQLLGVSSFTLEDAKKAKLTGKDIWTAYARNMLFARAMSNGVRWYCPDVFGGITAYTPEELGATVTIDHQGEELVTEPAVTPQRSVVTEPVSPPDPTPTKDKPASKAMLERWSEIYAKARELGLGDLPVVQQDISAATLTLEAQKLKVRIAEHEAELQSKYADAAEIFDDQ